MTTWVPARRTRNFKQQWDMLHRRLAYRGGRKARSAERRIRRLVGPMYAVVSGVQVDVVRVGLRLLEGVCAPRQQTSPATEGATDK